MPNYSLSTSPSFPYHIQHFQSFVYLPPNSPSPSILSTLLTTYRPPLVLAISPTPSESCRWGAARDAHHVQGPGLFLTRTNKQHTQPVLRRWHALFTVYRAVVSVGDTHPSHPTRLWPPSVARTRHLALPSHSTRLWFLTSRTNGSL